MTTSAIGGHELTWLDNLKNGILNLLLHPFTPLMNYGFHFDCLFSNSSHCSNGESDAKLLVSKESLAQDYFRHVKNYMSQMLPPWGDQYSNSKEHARPGQDIRFWLENRSKLFVCSQLVLFTMVLIYRLAKDVRIIIKYVKSRLSYGHLIN